MSGMKRDKRAALVPTATRSNSNRAKQHTFSQPTPVSSKEEFVAAVGTTTPTKVDMPGKQRLIINKLSFLSQDAIIFNCFYLAMVHFWLQMCLIYGQEYQLWNWKQFGISSVGILHVYSSFSSERKKETFAAIIKSISKSEDKWHAIMSRGWAIVESDELNLVFSNILIVTMVMVTFDHSIFNLTKLPILFSGLCTILFINLRLRDTTIAKFIFQFLLTALGGSTLAWPEQHLSFVLELAWMFGYTLSACLYFAIVAPWLTAYSSLGVLLIPYNEMSVVFVSLLILLVALLSNYLLQVNRTQFGLDLRQLSKFYLEQNISALPFGDRVCGAVLISLHNLVQYELKSITWTSGYSISFFTKCCMYAIIFQILLTFFYSAVFPSSLTFQYWIAYVELCGVVSLVLLYFFRLKYHFETVSKQSYNPHESTSNISAGGEESPEVTSAKASPDARQEVKPPSERMKTLFNVNETECTNINSNQHARLNGVSPWTQVHNIRYLEEKQQEVKALLGSLTETVTYQQLQSSARKSSAAQGNPASKFSTGSVNGLSPVPSHGSLAVISELANSKSKKIASVKINDTATSANVSNTAKTDLSDGARQTSDLTAINSSWLESSELSAATKGEPTSGGTAASAAALAIQPTVLQGVSAATPLPTVIASPSLLRNYPASTASNVDHTSSSQSSSTHFNSSHQSSHLHVNNAGLGNVSNPQFQPRQVLKRSATLAAEQAAVSSNNVSDNAKSSNVQRSSATTHSKFNSITDAAPPSSSSSNAQTNAYATSKNKKVSSSAAASHSSHNLNRSSGHDAHNSSSNRLSIDVSPATLGHTGASSNNHNIVSPHQSPLLSAGTPSSSPAAPTADGSAVVPAVTIMSITHHHGGPITATSITTTTTTSTPGTTNTVSTFSSNPAPGLAQQRKSRSNDHIMQTNGPAQTSGSHSGSASHHKQQHFGGHRSSRGPPAANPSSATLSATPTNNNSCSSSAT